MSKEEYDELSKLYESICDDIDRVVAPHGLVTVNYNSDFQRPIALEIRLEEKEKLSERSVNEVSKSEIPEFLGIPGKWVKVRDTVCWWYECSNCHERPLRDVYHRDCLSLVCPHCGSIMTDSDPQEE